MITKNDIELNYWNLINEIGSYNDKWADIVTTKTDILDGLIRNIDPTAKTILFTSFNPIALELSNNYEVSVICDKSFSSSFDFTLNSKLPERFDESIMSNCQYNNCSLF